MGKTSGEVGKSGSVQDECIWTLEFEWFGGCVAVGAEVIGGFGGNFVRGRRVGEEG